MRLHACGPIQRSQARPEYRPGNRTRRTRLRNRLRDEKPTEIVELLQDVRRTRFSKTVDTTGWQNHCHEQLTFAIKSAGDSYLAVSKLLRRPQYVKPLSKFTHKGKKEVLSREKALEARNTELKAAHKIPEHYEQASPSWLYNLNNSTHVDALLNFLIYGSAAAAGKSQHQALPWDNLGYGERYELCRTELPALTYLDGNANSVPQQSNPRLGVKCWEIVELESVHYNNPRSVRDQIAAIDRAIVLADIDTVGTLVQKKQAIAAAAVEEARKSGSGFVSRSAALLIHVRRAVEIPQRHCNDDLVEYGNQHLQLPGYYLLDAGELVFPLAAMENITQEFAAWFDDVVCYHAKHPEQVERVPFTRIFLQGLGPRRKISQDHGCGFDGMERDEVIQRYAWEIKHPYNQMPGNVFRQISRWNYRYDWHDIELKQLLLGKMAHRTRGLFRAERLAEILNKPQPYLWTKPNCSTTKFTRLLRDHGQRLPRAIQEYHPEYLDRLGAWTCGLVAWDPRWPGSPRQARRDAAHVAVLAGRAQRLAARVLCFLACMAVLCRKSPATQAPETIEWFYTGREIAGLLPEPNSRGPPLSYSA